MTRLRLRCDGPKFGLSSFSSTCRPVGSPLVRLPVAQTPVPGIPGERDRKDRTFNIRQRLNPRHLSWTFGTPRDRDRECGKGEVLVSGRNRPRSRDKGLRSRAVSGTDPEGPIGASTGMGTSSGSRRDPQYQGGGVSERRGGPEPLFPPPSFFLSGTTEGQIGGKGDGRRG